MMTFNLIADRWLPCRRVSGARAFFAPHDIVSDFQSDPIVALDFPRPDWNAAVMELLIGLLSVAMPPGDADEWAARWITPPTPDELKAVLTPLEFAFNLDGDGPRCFQDMAPGELKERNDVGALLIDAPGDNTAKLNKDLFVKRAGVDALCLPYVAAALVTLQTYAPSGGQGNRTSMRGGGPLTMLVAPKRRHKCEEPLTTLWDLTWSNVIVWHDLEPVAAAAQRIFPWLAPTRTSSNDEPTIPHEHADLRQAFFGMPRRIRLDIEPSGRCALDGPADRGIVRSYAAVNYGVKYVAWKHPLSPYYTDKKSGLLPLHPQAGLTTYADWLAWWGLKAASGGGDPANPLQAPETLRSWPARAEAIADANAIDMRATRQRGVLAVGFDMDNMKARGWLDERIPYYEPPTNAPSGWSHQFQQTVGQLVAGAGAAANALKYALRLARFGKRDGDGFKLLSNAPKDAFDDVAALLWRDTEEAFVKALDVLHGDPSDADRKVRSAFLPELRREAARLFDAASNIDSLADQDAKRLVMAKKGLVFALSAKGAVAQALGLAAPKVSKRKKP